MEFNVIRSVCSDTRCGDKNSNLAREGRARRETDVHVE
jgi:hypothetical protein